MAAHLEPNPVHEVQDTGSWTFFDFLFGKPVTWELQPINLGFYKFQITKFMILELVAAGIILLIYMRLARRIREGGLPTGRWWNLFEGVLTFIRDNVARPNLDSHHDPKHAHAHAHGHDEHVEHHEADKYVPFLWTLFLFILVCNLLGAIPTLGSPTASIWMTGGMALIAFVMMHAAPIAKVGAGNYFKSLWPRFDLPAGLHFQALSVMLTLGIGMIEIMGTFIKAGVLAVRLFANMFAGHLVLANILFFIYAVGKNGTGLLFGTVTLFSIVGVVGLSLLELFVAFLQAYIFVFLTALFIGMSLHHAEQH